MNQNPNNNVTKKVKKRKKKNVIVTIINAMIIVAASVLLAMAIIFFFTDAYGIGAKDKEVVINIEENMTAEEVADILEENQIIDNSVMFMGYVKLFSENFVLDRKSVV